MYGLIQTILILATPFGVIAIWIYALKPGNAGVLILGEGILIASMIEVNRRLGAARLSARKQKLKKNGT